MKYEVKHPSFPSLLLMAVWMTGQASGQPLTYQLISGPHSMVAAEMRACAYVDTNCWIGLANSHVQLLNLAPSNRVLMRMDVPLTHPVAALSADNQLVVATDLKTNLSVGSIDGTVPFTSFTFDSTIAAAQTLGNRVVVALATGRVVVSANPLAPPSQVVWTDVLPLAGLSADKVTVEVIASNGFIVISQTQHRTNRVAILGGAPWSLQSVSPWQSVGHRSPLAVANGFLYFAYDDRLSLAPNVWDISDPTQPAEAGSWGARATVGTNKVITLGSRTWVSQTGEIFDCPNPSAIKSIGLSFTDEAKLNLASFAPHIVGSSSTFGLWDQTGITFFKLRHQPSDYGVRFAAFQGRGKVNCLTRRGSTVFAYYLNNSTLASFSVGDDQALIPQASLLVNVGPNVGELVALAPTPWGLVGFTRSSAIQQFTIGSDGSVTQEATDRDNLARTLSGLNFNRDDGLIKVIAYPGVNFTVDRYTVDASTFPVKRSAVESVLFDTDKGTIQHQASGGYTSIGSTIYRNGDLGTALLTLPGAVGDAPLDMTNLTYTPRADGIYGLRIFPARYSVFPLPVPNDLLNSLAAKPGTPRVQRLGQSDYYTHSEPGDGASAVLSACSLTLANHFGLPGTNYVSFVDRRFDGFIAGWINQYGWIELGNFGITGTGQFTKPAYVSDVTPPAWIVGSLESAYSLLAAPPVPFRRFFGLWADQRFTPLPVYSLLTIDIKSPLQPKSENVFTLAGTNAPTAMLALSENEVIVLAGSTLNRVYRNADSAWVSDDYSTDLNLLDLTVINGMPVAWSKTSVIYASRDRQGGLLWNAVPGGVPEGIARVYACGTTGVIIQETGAVNLLETTARITISEQISGSFSSAFWDSDRLILIGTQGVPYAILNGPAPELHFTHCNGVGLILNPDNHLTCSVVGTPGAHVIVERQLDGGAWQLGGSATLAGDGRGIVEMIIGNGHLSLFRARYAN